MRNIITPILDDLEQLIALKSTLDPIEYLKKLHKIEVKIIALISVDDLSLKEKQALELLISIF